MSTNAIINVEGVNNISIYKHWDGYPAATFSFLDSFNSDFEATRPNDPNYKIAQLLRASMIEGLDHGLDPSRYTGWGLYDFESQAPEGGYLYTLTKTGAILIDGLTKAEFIDQRGISAWED